MLKFKGDCTMELWAHVAYGAIVGRECSADEAIRLADELTEAMNARIDWDGDPEEDAQDTEAEDAVD